MPTLKLKLSVPSLQTLSNLGLLSDVQALLTNLEARAVYFENASGTSLIAQQLENCKEWVIY